jgi:hypothetical protein
MRSQTLRCLLDGNYICEYAFPQEYVYLTSDNNETFVNEWLSAIDMRLARVGDDGPFFMAPQSLSTDDNARIREEFLRFRDVYGPAIRMLQVIRNAKDEFSLNPGEYIQHAELVQRINEIAALAEQLRSLVGVIRETDARYTNAELVKRLLEHLRKDGYLVIVDAATEMYRSTGKVMQLTQVLRFLGENAEFARTSQDESEAIEVVDDLFDRPMQP